MAPPKMESELKLETDSRGVQRLALQPEGWNTWKWRGHNVNWLGAGTEGPPVVLIHGFGASAYHWRYNVPEVYALDCLGFGWSSKPLVDYKGYNLWEEQIAGKGQCDLLLGLTADFIREVVGGDKAIVVGNSLGGYNATAVAANYPELVRGVVLLNAAGRFDDPNAPTKVPEAAAAAAADVTPGMWYRMMDQVSSFTKRNMVLASFYYAKSPMRIRQVLRQVYHCPASLDEDLVQSIAIPAQDPNAAEVFYRIITGSGKPMNRLLDKLDGMPLLLLWGSKENTPAPGETRGVDKQLASAIAAQQGKRNASEAVEVQIVREAPKAKLFSGDGDVATNGDCEDDIDARCQGVKPGEGRLADCLGKQMEEQRKGNTKGKHVSEECVKELSAFRIDRGSNINKNIPLARACRGDVIRLCRNAFFNSTGPGLVLRCLKSQQESLSLICKQRLFKAMLEEAKDFRVDPALREACGTDAASLCQDVEPQEGGMINCLLARRGRASSDCQKQLLRAERERSSDFRLNRPTARVCAGEVQRFCEGLEPGEGRVWRCLEDHRQQAGFSAGCRSYLESFMQRQSSDYRLNYGLRASCEDDIARLCAEEKEQIDNSQGAGADSKVILCLETQRKQIRSPQCKLEVARQLVREAADIRFDHTVAQQCYEDRNKHCSHVQQGSARVIRCLHDHQAQLSSDCAAALFDHEVKLAEDIDFKYPLKQACLVEMDMFCKNAQHGHARVIRCLQVHLDRPDMSSECRAEVERDQQQSASDYRLNYRLKEACMEDVRTHCSDLAHTCSLEKGCSGRVLQCLQNHLDKLQGEQCKEEVFYFVKMEVNDYRNDVVLAEACKADVDQFCQNVGPGEGRVHACLRERLEELSPDCRREQLKLMVLQARDVRLRPKLQRLCSEELAVFCKGVAPGRGRKFRCLQDNLAKPDFGPECREEVSNRIRQSQESWQLDYGVAAQCADDVEALCKEEKGQAHARAAVLKCLVANYQAASQPCQGELSRSVRLALWDYSPGAALTEPCDADVQRACPPTQAQRSMFTIGAVGRCLAQQAAAATQPSLQPGCKQLVMVAAPKDAKALFEDAGTVDAVAARVAEIARAAGLSSAFVAPQGTGGFTLTGWVALAALGASAVVGVALAGRGLKRWAAAGRQGGGGGAYTRVVKRGDV
ncbi:hypothetical protein N2152v2_010148 [Parachlorella kessleri]